MIVREVYEYTLGFRIVNFFYENGALKEYVWGGANQSELALQARREAVKKYPNKNWQIIADICYKQKTTVGETS